MASYDAHQITFYLSMLANITSRYETSDVTLMGNQYILALAPNVDVQVSSVSGYTPAKVQASTVGLIGNWTLVWGPSVELHHSAASNSMFVAYNPAVDFSDGSFPTYVVAIAGTDPSSFFDWVVEDGNVIEFVDFAAFVAAGGVMSGLEVKGGRAATSAEAILPPLTTAHISKGTAVGVSALAHMVPTPSGVGGVVTLEAFLKSVASPAARIVFTGHSLGGALSPTLALFLQKRGALSGFNQALAYPTAGPTPGNQPFANAFAAAFPPTPSPANHKVWNRDIINSRDVVPHAWQRATLKQIYKIYGNDVFHPLPISVKLAIDAALGLSNLAADLGMVYERLPHWEDQRAFSGTPPSDFKDFFTVLVNEHINAYYQAKVYAPGPGIILPAPPQYDYSAIATLPGVSVRSS